MPDTKDSLIQIVDDNANNLKVLGALLSSRGYRVALSASGEECLDFVAKQLPDLIFLDIMMPGLNGFEVSERLKQNPETADIPVIFISALSNPQQVSKAFESGAVDYIVKPFNKDDVLARAQIHLKLKKEKEILKSRIHELEARIKELENN